MTLALGNRTFQQNMKSETRSVFFLAMLMALVVAGCSTPNAGMRRGAVDESGFTDISSAFNNWTNWIDGPMREF